MGKRAFYDPLSGILKAVGYILSNEEGDLFEEEDGDFDLKPGEWYRTPHGWVPFIAPTPVPLVDVGATVDTEMAVQRVLQELTDRVRGLEQRTSSVEQAVSEQLTTNEVNHGLAKVDGEGRSS